jgi:hypothetical protein
MRIEENGEADERRCRASFLRFSADGVLVSAPGSWSLQSALLPFTRLKSEVLFARAPEKSSEEYSISNCGQTE